MFGNVRAQLGMKTRRPKERPIHTPSRKRVETMVEAVHSLTNSKGSGLFLFVDRETLGASNPLDVEWMSGKGERVRLMS